MTLEQQAVLKRYIEEKVDGINSNDFDSFREVQHAVVDFVVENIDDLANANFTQNYYDTIEQQKKQAKIASLQAELDALPAKQAELQKQLDELTK